MKNIIYFILGLSLTVFCIPSLSAVPSPKTIMLVIAMEEEAKPIIKALHLQKLIAQFAPLPMQSYSGHYLNLNIILILNGLDKQLGVSNVGTQAATLTTYLGIQRFHPDLVISVGTAGGIATKGAKIGDIYVSEKIDFFDRVIPLQRYAEYGIGHYPSANIDPILQQLQIKKGIICSSDSFVYDPIAYQALIRQNCAVREMEAAGVAWVCQLMATPMLALKGITNTVAEDNAHHDFDSHFNAINLKLSQQLKNILTLMARSRDNENK